MYMHACLYCLVFLFIQKTTAAYTHATKKNNVLNIMSMKNKPRIGLNVSLASRNKPRHRSTCTDMRTLNTVQYTHIC